MTVAPPFDAGLLPAESVEDALSRMRPLWVLPSVQGALDGYRAQADGESVARLTSYEAALGEAVTTGTLRPVRWRHEPSGRIRLYDPSSQQIANVLRPHVAPSEGCVFVDADWKNAHMHIAAARSDDGTLRRALAGGDLYDRIALKLLPEAEPHAARAVAKRVALAALNGGTDATLRRSLAPLVGVERAAGVAEVALAAFWRSFPKLAAFRDSVFARWCARASDVLTVSTLTGRVLQIDTGGRGKGGWRTLLAAHWTCVEAEALDYVLARLHGAIGDDGGALVLPMFDGVLVEAPTANGAVVAERVDGLMRWSMEGAGVPGVGVETEQRDRWGI